MKKEYSNSKVASWENITVVQNNMSLKEIKDFCGETSIHGLGQIANDTGSTVKRLLWFGIFIGSLCYAGQQLKISIQGT